MITDDQLADWQKLADAATAGPWEYGTGKRVVAVSTGDTLLMACGDDRTDRREENCELSAAGREAVPLLIAETRALRQQLERARELLRRFGETETQEAAMEFEISIGAFLAEEKEQKSPRALVLRTCSCGRVVDGKCVGCGAIVFEPFLAEVKRT